MSQPVKSLYLYEVEVDLYHPLLTWHFEARLQKNEVLRSIPTGHICNTVLNSPIGKSFWENIIFIINLFVKVR